MSGPLLQARGLHAGYSGVAVARDVDVTLTAGRVTALLGPNGAGKSTVLLTLAGLLPPLEGEIEVLGSGLASLGPERAARAGLSLVPDDRALFTSLTTMENLEVVRRSGAADPAEMLELFPALAQRRDVRASLLSGGEQQMLAIARALINRPRVLLVDELSMGLAPEIVRGILPVLRRAAADTGAAVLLVEQHVGLVLTIADDALVLVHGDVVLRADAEELRRRPELLERAYLGTGAPAP